MVTRLICSLLGLSLTGLVFTSCKQAEKPKDAQPVVGEILMQDYGAQPVVLNIESYTTGNDNFRTALWTGTKLQVTLMSIPEGGDVGLEQHMHTDQFLRIEEGEAEVMMGDSKDSLDFRATAGPDSAIFIPAGKWHNIVNAGAGPLKLYSIYSPVEHPLGTIHKTQKEAMEAEHHE